MVTIGSPRQRDTDTKSPFTLPFTLPHPYIIPRSHADCSSFVHKSLFSIPRRAQTIGTSYNVHAQEILLCFAIYWFLDSHCSPPSHEQPHQFAAHDRIFKSLASRKFTRDRCTKPARLAYFLHWCTAIHKAFLECLFFHRNATRAR